MSHTDPVSDSGFVDEAPTGPERPRRTRAARVVEEPTTNQAGRAKRARGRPGPVGVAFVVLLVGLLGFGGWAWTSRAHADDLAAYTSLTDEIEELDHSLTPLGHSEIPPCRDAYDGLVTRTYPPSTGPQAAELVGFLEQSGWTKQPAAPPTFVRLTRTESGHELTIDVVAPTESSLVTSLTARSPGSRVGCLLR